MDANLSNIVIVYSAVDVVMMRIVYRYVHNYSQRIMKTRCSVI